MAQPTLPDPGVEKFWSFYLSEGQREDDVAFQAWQGDMEKTLLLAGLFSVSLTSLLVENLTFVSKYMWVTVVWSLSLILSFFAAFGALLVQRWIRQYHRNLSSSPDPVRRAKWRMYLFGGRRSRHLGTIVASVLASLHIAFILFCLGFVGFLHHFSRTASTICIPFLSIGGLLYFSGTIDHTINVWSPFATPPARVITWFGSYFRYIRSGQHTGQPEGVTVSPGGEAMDIEPNEWMVAEGMNWLINQSLSRHDIPKTETFLDGIPGFIVNHWQGSGWKNVSHDNKKSLLNAIFYLVTTCTSNPPIPIEIRRPRVVVTLRALVYLTVFDQKGHPANDVPAERFEELKSLGGDGDSVIVAWANCTLAFLVRRVLQKHSNRIGCFQRLPDGFLTEVDDVLEIMEMERRSVEDELDKDTITEGYESYNSIPDFRTAELASLSQQDIKSACEPIGSLKETIMTCRTKCGFGEKFEHDLMDYKTGFRFSDPLLLLLAQILLLERIVMSTTLLKSDVLHLQGNLRGIHLLPKLPEDLDFRSVLYNDPNEHTHAGFVSSPAVRETLAFLQRKSQDQNKDRPQPWLQNAIKRRERNRNNRLKLNPFMHSIPESIRRPYRSLAWLLSDLADTKVAIQMHWIVLSLYWGPANAPESYDDQEAFGEPLEYLKQYLIEDFQQPQSNSAESESRLHTKEALSRLLCLVVTQAIDPASPHKIPTIVIEFLVKVIEGVLNLPPDNRPDGSHIPFEQKPVTTPQSEDIYLSEIADALEYYAEVSANRIVHRVGRRVRRQVLHCGLNENTTPSFS